MPNTKRFNVKMTSKFTEGGSDNTSAARPRPNGTNRAAITRPIEVRDLEENEESLFLPEPNTPSSKYQKSNVPLFDHRSMLLALMSIATSIYLYDHILSPLITSSKLRRDFTLAKRDSGGFFDDISSDDWEIMKERVRERQNHLNPTDPELWMSSPHAWYQNNWEPDFTCEHERRVGGMGDGPKWVCDPHRIPRIANDRIKHGGSGCLVYSVGSAGNFEFELGLQSEIGAETCEIHIFDILDFQGVVPEGMTFHQWGLETSEELTMGKPYKSFQEIVASLGHQGRTIDIFKIDCEGCEWRTFNDWFSSDVDILQILVEVHFSPSNANTFFDSLQDQGYVTFHKEPNIIFGGGNCQEYAMLKLAPGFYDK